MSEQEFRPGQIVEAVWPDGTMLRGKVKRNEDGLFYLATPPGNAWSVDWLAEHGATLTVVREPIPDEPPGRWALFSDSDGRLWVRDRRGADDTAPWKALSASWVRCRWSDIAADGGRVVWAGEQP